MTESSASRQIAHLNRRKRLNRRGRTAVFVGSFMILVALVVKNNAIQHAKR